MAYPRLESPLHHLAICHTRWGRLQLAVRGIHLGMVRNVLVEDPSQVNSGDLDGNTCVHWAASLVDHTGGVFVLECLLNTPEVDLQIQNAAGNTAFDVYLHCCSDLMLLQVAIRTNNLNWVQGILTKHPALINMVDSSGDTALHWAVRLNLSQISQYLLAVDGIDLKIQNKAGHMAYH